MGTQKFDGGQRLQRRDVPAAGHHDVGFAPFVVARPFPDTHAEFAVPDSLLDVEPLRGRLLARDDHVHMVVAAQTVIRDREQAVGVRRQVDANDVGLLVHDMVDEPRILVGEAVMILAPDMA
jgi:hypothetical protein